MITRLHRRVFGVQKDVPVMGDFSRVVIHHPARGMLAQLLSVKGRWQSGLLFGNVADDVLHVWYAAPDGYPGWERSLLDFDPRYALGWVDALSQQDKQTLDWVGHWVARPDSRFPDTVQSEMLLQHASAHGLVDDQHVLMLLGYVDGALTAQAMRQLDDDADYVPVDSNIQ